MVTVVVYTGFFGTFFKLKSLTFCESYCNLVDHELTLLFVPSVSKLVYCDQTPNAYMTQLINLVTKEAFNHELINIFHKVFLKIQRFEKRPLKFEQRSAALWELHSFLGCSV